MTPRRALLVALVASGIIACASQGMPPGGPPDAELPQLQQILPDSNAVNVRAPAVVLRFDEVVSERSSASSGAAGAPAGGSGGAASGLAGLLVLSPSDGRDEVVWRREALELRPRRGFRPNTAYRVTLLPGLADLRGNRVTTPFSFVFSTGPSIPQGEVSGVLFDWTTGRPAVNARVDLFTPRDSTFRWTARTDSLGRFRVRELTAGTYEVRAWIDTNNDRRISFRELSDSARVALADTASLELYAYGRDTLPPRLELVEWVDSTAIRIRLDRGIVADWDGTSAELVGADSVTIPLGGPFVPSVVYDSLARIRAEALRDSLAADSAAADSSAADSSVTKGEILVPAPRAPDTVRVENTRPAPRGEAVVPAPRAPDTVRVENTRPEPRDTAAADSAAADSVVADAVNRPVFRRVVPVTQWTAPLAAPLAPGLYRFRIRDARGLNGRALATERELRIQPRPPRPAAADSTARDSTAQRP